MDAREQIVGNMEDYSAVRQMMEANLARMPTSDRVVLSKIWTLNTENPYKEEVLGILSTLTYRWGMASDDEYAQVKLETVREAVEVLWTRAQKVETSKMFLDFESFEKVLFQSNAEYRGHYAHQFDVFLLGYYILNRILETNNPAAEKFKTSTSPNFTWMLASTFHDMGYPIQQIDEWLSAFLKTFLKIDSRYSIEIERILTPVFFDYLKFVSEEHYNRIAEPMTPSSVSPVKDWAFHSYLQEKLRRKDHGVVSSLLLIHSILTQEKIAKSREWFFNTFPKEVLPACHAIALHNLEDVPKSFGKCPYAYLLVLCDSIQDWQRSLGATDYSELKAITVDFSDNIPAIKAGLLINDVKKVDELNKLSRGLETDGLIRVEIRQTNGEGKWTMS